MIVLNKDANYTASETPVNTWDPLLGLPLLLNKIIQISGHSLQIYNVDELQSLSSPI